MFLDFFVLFCDARRPRGFPKAESLLVEGLGVGGGVLELFSLRVVPSRTIPRPGFEWSFRICSKQKSNSSRFEKPRLA